MGEQFDLPLGVVRNGEVQREIVLNPMTAKTRRLLAVKANQKNPSGGLTQVIRDCCESIAGDPPSEAVISNLATGDRDFILLKLRMMSLGDNVSVQMICPRCSEEIAFDLDLTSIKIVTLNKDEHYELVHDTPVFTLTNEELGLVVKLRPPTGYDQAAITKQMGSDPVGATYTLYSRILQSWTKGGEDEVNPNSLQFIDGLPLKEIDWLEEVSQKIMPGPDWTVRLTCDLCSKTAMLDLSDSDFLFKTPR